MGSPHLWYNMTICLPSKFSREGHENWAEEDDGRAGCCRLARHCNHVPFSLLKQYLRGHLGSKGSRRIDCQKGRSSLYRCDKGTAKGEGNVCGTVFHQRTL